MTDQNAGTAEEISLRGRSRRRGSARPEQGHTEKDAKKIEREERTRRQTKREKHAEPESSGSESAKMTAQILNPEWSEEETVSETAGEHRPTRARSRRRGSQNEEARRVQASEGARRAGTDNLESGRSENHHSGNNRSENNRLGNSDSGTGNSSEDGQARRSVRRSRARQNSEPVQVNAFEASAGGAVAVEMPRRGMSRSRSAREEALRREAEAMRQESAVADEEKTSSISGKAVLKGLGIVAGIALVVAGGVYVGLAQKYKTVYFPNTLINGIDASGLTPDQVKEQIEAGINQYTITIRERGDQTEQLSGPQIDLHPVYDGTLEKLIEDQNPYVWGKYLRTDRIFTMDTIVAFDETKMDEVFHSLACMDPEQVTAPVDAHRSDYISGTGYQVVEEVQGNTLDEQSALSVISEAIIGLSDEVSLEDADVYLKPAITSDNEDLQNKVAMWNKYVGAKITYKFGSARQTLDGDTINTWLSDDGEGNPVLSSSKIVEYVAQMAKERNTAYQPKTLKTTTGKTVTIKGPYGWKINQDAEASTLRGLIEAGETQEREPQYSQKAASHDGNDYGSTYVEINLTAQHLYFYKGGSLVVQSDFVSGNESKGWSTPAGAYPLTYKQRNATLKGENYSTPVSYWMPFNGGIGLHDAYWRSSFGGTIYKTNGSHGCINLPPAVAKTIYENISAGTAVLCYH